MNLISLFIHRKPYGAAQFLIQTFLKISRRDRDVSTGRVVMKDEGFQLPENGQHPSGSIPFKNPIQKCFCSFHFDSALGLALGRIPAIAALSCMTHGHKNQLPVLFIHRNLCGAACRALSSKTFLLKSSTASFFPSPRGNLSSASAAAWKMKTHLCLSGPEGTKRRRWPWPASPGTFSLGPGAPFQLSLGL